MSQITQTTVDNLNLPKVLDLDTFVSQSSTAKKGLRVLTDPEKDTLNTLFRESIQSINQYDTDSKPLKTRLKTLALNMLTTSQHYRRTTQGIGKDFALDLLQQLYKIKNGVHLEIAFFSSIYDLIGFNKKLFDKVNSSSSIPFRIFDDILTIIPNLCNAITLNETHTEIHINIRELFADFERTDVNDNSHDFDQVMLTHMSQFTLDENTLQVPIKNIPDEVSINNLRENPDPKIKLIGQLFLLCHLYKEKITDLKHNLIIAETILGKLDTTLRVEPGSPPQKIFDEYTSIRNYIPLLFSIIDQRTELNSRGLPLNQLLFLPDRCSQIIDYAGTKWKEELASFYGLILTIENIAKKILTPTDKNESIATENHLSRPDIKKMHTQLALFYAQSWSLPSLNQAGFCETADGFYDLTCKFSFDAEKIKAIKSPSQASPTDSAGKKKGKHKKFKPTVVALTSPSSVSTLLSPGILANTNLEENKEEVPDLAVTGERHAATNESEISSESFAEKLAATEREEPDENTNPWLPVGKKTSDIEIIKEATGVELAQSIQRNLNKTFQTKTRTMQLHPRVSSWFSSKEEGLQYRTVVEQQKITNPEQTILRHLFPKSILTAIQSRVYSQFKDDRRNPGIRNYTSLLKIDSKKYVLEASFNQKGFLYHLYAKPLDKIADYFSNRELGVAIDDDADQLIYTPQITDYSQEPFTILENGNAQFEFEGSLYEIVNLIKK